MLPLNFNYTPGPRRAAVGKRGGSTAQAAAGGVEAIDMEAAEDTQVLQDWAAAEASELAEPPLASTGGGGGSSGSRDGPVGRAQPAAVPPAPVGRPWRDAGGIVWLRERSDAQPRRLGLALLVFYR